MNDKPMTGFCVGFEWWSPGYCAYAADWWFSYSIGSGNIGKHLTVTFLGLTFAFLRYYK
jgi:hypothetical protein